MKPYTVILMHPDYYAETYGQDSTVRHVNAREPGTEIRRAQRDAAQEAECDDQESDWFPIACFAGHLQDVAGTA